MSYAQAAAKGPKQSPEEARAPQPAQIAHEESSISSLVDVDSPHISSVPSSYSGETSTQAKREEREAEEAERKAKAKFEEVEGETAKKYEKAKGAAARKGKQAKETMKGKGESFDKNKENPVVIGNMVVIGLGSAALGYGAYRKYSAGQLTWKVAGAWAGIVGLFATGDYFMSQYLFKNQYPPK